MSDRQTARHAASASGVGVKDSGASAPAVSDEAAQDLAPAVVVRAAAWSLDAVLPLADTEIASAARADMPDYAHRYPEAMSRQRQQLWAATADDPRFARALALANPSLAHDILARGRSAQANKRARHLDTTLYRYLARAVGRTEPCALWAGVGLAPFGACTRVLECDARLALAPDLAPLRALWNAVVRAPRYGRRGWFKLNPTLVRGSDGAWTFRAYRRTSELRRLVARPWVDHVLSVLERTPPLAWHALARRCAAPDGATAEQADARVQALRECGVLVGGLRFPARFETAWHALAVAGRALAIEDRRPWNAAVGALRLLCRRLARRGAAQASAQAMLDAQAETQRIIAELARGLGQAPPPASRTPLRGDAGLPWRIELGPEWRDRLARAVTDVEELEARAGLARAADAAHADRLVAAAGTRSGAGGRVGVLTTWEDLCQLLGQPPALARAVAAWRRWIATGAWVAPLDGGTEPPRTPLASLLLRVDGAQLGMRGLSADVASAYGRFGALLAERRPHDHALHRWLSAALADLQRRSGVDLIELVSDEDELPNTAARPDGLARRVLDRWGGTADQVPARSLRIEIDARSGMPVARFDGGGDAVSAAPAIVALFSAVDLGARDPGVERLLLTSGRVMPPWASVAGTPFGSELARARPTPALRLPSGVEARPWRHVVSGDVLDGLTHAPRAERFRRWQQLAAAHDWPALLVVRLDGRAPLLVVRDSPLAVEATFEGSHGHADLLIVEAAGDGGWLTDEEGRRYATEIVVPFVRRRHPWCGRARELDSGERGAA